MPIVELTLSAGRTPEQKRAALAALHDAVVSSLGVPDAAVRVILREVPPEHWLTGGVTLAEKAQQPVAG